MPVLDSTKEEEFDARVSQAINDHLIVSAAGSDGGDTQEDGGDTEEERLPDPDKGI